MPEQSKYGILDKQSADRTEKVVIKVEHQVFNHSIQPHRRYPITPIPGFWARITYIDPDSKRYSFQQVIAQDLDNPDVMDDNEGGKSGDYTADVGFAFEVSGSRDVAIDSIQWVTPSKNQPFYLFKDSNSNKRIPAKITGKETGEFAFKYSWTKLISQDDFSFQVSDDPNDIHLFSDDSFAVDLNSFDYCLTNDDIYVQKTEGKSSYEFLYIGGINMATTPVGGIASNGDAMCTCGEDTIKVYNPWSVQIGKSGSTATIQIGYSPNQAKWLVVGEACST